MKIKSISLFIALFLQSVLISTASAGVFDIVKIAANPASLITDHIQNPTVQNLVDPMHIPHRMVAGQLAPRGEVPAAATEARGNQPDSRPTDRNREIAEAGENCRGLFTEFRGDNNPAEEFVSNFVRRTVRILLKYPVHLPIAQENFDSETRLLYKVIIGSIVFIAQPDNQAMLDWLRDSGGFTEENFDQLRQIRATSQPLLTTSSGAVATAHFIMLRESRDLIHDFVSALLSRMQ